MPYSFLTRNELSCVIVNCQPAPCTKVYYEVKDRCIRKLLLGFEIFTFDLAMASSSPISRVAFLPGSRPRGGGSSTAQLWPNPVPLECGVIRLPEKLSTAKLGHTASGGQKFPINVSEGSMTVVIINNLINNHRLVLMSQATPTVPWGHVLYSCIIIATEETAALLQRKRKIMLPKY